MSFTITWSMQHSSKHRKCDILCIAFCSICRMDCFSKVFLKIGNCVFKILLLRVDFLCFCLDHNNIVKHCYLWLMYIPKQLKKQTCSFWTFKSHKREVWMSRLLFSCEVCAFSCKICHLIISAFPP